MRFFEMPFAWVELGGKGGEITFNVVDCNNT